MKKKFLILALALFWGSLPVFSRTGLGVQGGVGVGNLPFHGEAGITFKLSTVPVTFGLDYSFAKDFQGIGVTADWWVANPKLFGMFKFYYGPGFAFHFYNPGTQNPGIFVAARAVLGMNVFVSDVVEFYAQPAIEAGYGTYGGFVFKVPLDAGVRFWF
ncbi:MAG: hypothetical protein J5930_05850 [Treponema sp.]|nr:hypothetical protein [Treponema sp.]